MKRVAIIDIGSKSIKFFVGEKQADGTIKTLLDNGVAPPKSAADAEQMMQIIKDRYHTLLQDNLVGIYLHGSLAAGCFHWERSDIDFLVVVRRPLTVDKKIALSVYDR